MSNPEHNDWNGQPPQGWGPPEGPQGWGPPTGGPQQGWGPPAGGPHQGGPEQAQGAPPNAWGAPAQPGQYGQPPAGQYGGQYGQPPAGQYGGQYGQYGGGQGPPGWSAVPRPGIVPLRPLTLGEIYDGAIRSIRTNPGVMFVFTAVLVALSTAIQGALTWSSFEELNSLAGMDPDTLESAGMDSLLSTVQSALVGWSISALMTFLITTILNGLLIHAVSQAVLGRSASLAQVWNAVKGQIPRLLLLSVVVAVMMTVLVLIFVGLLAAAAVSENGALIGLTVMAFILLLLPALLALATFTLLATPALVLERAGVGTALRRSFQLVKRSFWRVLGIYLLTSIIVAVLAWVISSPASLFGPLLGSAAGMYIVTLVAGVIASAITTPFMAAVVALLYIDVRMRTEALDVELARAAAQG